MIRFAVDPLGLVLVGKIYCQREVYAVSRLAYTLCPVPSCAVAPLGKANEMCDTEGKKCILKLYRVRYLQGTTVYAGHRGSWVGDSTKVTLEKKKRNRETRRNRGDEEKGCQQKRLRGGTKLGLETRKKETNSLLRHRDNKGRDF